MRLISRIIISILIGVLFALAAMELSKADAVKEPTHPIITQPLALSIPTIEAHHPAIPPSIQTNRKDFKTTLRIYVAMFMVILVFSAFYSMRKPTTEQP